MSDEAELDSPRRVDDALVKLRERNYLRVNNPRTMSERKRNPISTLDDAVMWLASVGGDITFEYGWVALQVPDENDDYNAFGFVKRKIGDGGFDARDTLMMATRELWEMVNG